LFESDGKNERSIPKQTMPKKSPFQKSTLPFTHNKKPAGKSGVF
jgi:hypothetical protein